MDKIELFRYLVEKEELHLKVNSDTLSMSPFICQGDYIFLHRYDSIPQPGDIILVSFREETYLVCHRVVYNGHIIYTKGDNNYNKDYSADGYHDISNSYIATVNGVLRGGCYIDLTTKRSEFINKLIARISVNCVPKRNLYLTELNFSLCRIAMILLQFFYKKQKYSMDEVEHISSNTPFKKITNSHRINF